MTTENCIDSIQIFLLAAQRSDQINPRALSPSFSSPLTLDTTFKVTSIESVRFENHNYAMSLKLSE